MLKRIVFLSLLLCIIRPVAGRVFTHYINNMTYYSSLIDPEDSYSASRSFLDVGIYPNKQYNGEGIKIGIIDDGIPQDLSDYAGRYSIYGYTSGTHVNGVASVLAGLDGVASNAMVCFASRQDYDFFQCVNWLVNIEHVDVINFSGGLDTADNGKYTQYGSGILESIIKNNGVPIVCAAGNNSDIVEENRLINTSAVTINAIGVGSRDKNGAISQFSCEHLLNSLDTVINKPNSYAPGDCLFGFPLQNLNVHDYYRSDNNYVYVGTSYSAPIVTGIIALLMEEFPGLKGKPETVNCIVHNASRNGVINYQDARQIAKNYYNYTINETAVSGQLLLSVPVNIPYHESIIINNFVLFNGVFPSTPSSSHYVSASEIEFSNCRLVVESFSGITVEEEFGTFSHTSLEFTNETNDEDYYIKVFLYGNKSPTGVEKASLSYRLGTRPSEMFSLSVSNYNLDTKPSFSWSVNYPFSNGYVSLFIINYKNQVIVQKHNLPSSGSYILTLSEWHSVLSLRGKEYYAFLRVTNVNNKYFYSNRYILNEPRTFGYLSNINPADYGFASSYNNAIINSSMTIDGITIYIERLRCGYIEDQYLNLSSKKHGAGHAYLQLTFDRTLKYLSFGVTVWRKQELKIVDGDTAVVDVMNSNGVWNEAIDLLYDVTLPNSRRDILRFDFTNIKGIRFDITSIIGGDGNKGRLCIDNISFTDDNNYNDYLCNYTEPIVVREDFGAPNYTELPY